MRQMRKLPPDVVIAIQRILEVQGSPDSIDSLTQFSPIPTLNRLFPDEASLGGIASTQARLKDDQAALQQEIDTLQDELRRDQDPARMQIIQELIAELLAQMSRIREKATESEAIVRDITKDIQVLDLAKKNLITSMTALKRFQSLVNSLGHLQILVDARKYAEIAQTLAAVKELAAVFRSYMAVERISSVWKRIQELQGTLRTFIDQEFDAFFLQDPAKEVSPSVVSDACLVVDVMGEDVRNHLIDRYCAIELKEYRRIFRANDEAGQLDNISRRYAWFRRLLAQHKEVSHVYPPSWKVGEHLCAKFAEVTRDDVISALGKAASSNSLTVTLLLEALQQTLEFESSIDKKYGVPFPELIMSVTHRTIKTISSAFDSYMGVFVDAQDKAISDMLSAYRGAKSRPSFENSASEEGLRILPSSTELFYFYKQNLDQCAKLSNGSPLYDLCSLHKKWLRIYAEDVLLASMKRTDRERKSLEGRVNINELKTACVLLNTADYCQATAIELEDKIKEKISDDYRDKVSLQAERDLFLSVISSTIGALLRELDAACEGPLSTMLRTVWGNLDHVSGPSAYIGDLVKAIESVTDVVREQVEPKKYLRNFYDKVSSLSITRFTNTLVKSRPLKEVGAEQILLDLQALRSCLLRLPGQQASDGASYTTYSKNITKSTTRLETLLKVVNAPVDPPDSFVLNYTVLVGDSSFSNFQKVLDLKGTPRAEQNILLDTFLTITSTKDDLESSSFLSALDMEPASSVPAVTSPTQGNRVSLPSLLSESGASLWSGMTSPPLVQGSSEPKTATDGVKFSDFRRFVNFAVRRDKENTFGS